MADDYLEARLAVISRFSKDIGFPILAYLLLFYLCTTTLQDNTRAIQDLTLAIQAMGGP